MIEVIVVTNTAFRSAVKKIFLRILFKMLYINKYYIELYHFILKKYFVIYMPDTVFFLTDGYYGLNILQK